MGASGQESGRRLNAWEIDLVSDVVRTIRTADPAALESDLMLHLLLLKRGREQQRVARWRAFLWTALRNKARNWIRDQQLQERHLLSLSEPQHPSDTGIALENRLASPDTDQSSARRLGRFLDQLDPDLFEVFQALDRSNGNHCQTARLLGVHRNTVRAKVRRLQLLLERAGFAPRR